MKLKRILALVLAGTLFMSVNGTAAAGYCSKSGAG